MLKISPQLYYHAPLLCSKVHYDNRSIPLGAKVVHHVRNSFTTSSIDCELELGADEPQVLAALCSLLSYLVGMGGLSKRRFCKSQLET
jgi:hypothetical protein